MKKRNNEINENIGDLACALHEVARKASLKILHFLMKNRGKVVPVHEIVEEVCENPSFVSKRLTALGRLGLVRKEDPTNRQSGYRVNSQALRGFFYEAEQYAGIAEMSPSQPGWLREPA